MLHTVGIAHVLAMLLKGGIPRLCYSFNLSTLPFSDLHHGLSPCLAYSLSQAQAVDSAMR